MGLWSGFKRNMELAESFLVAPITVSTLLPSDILWALE